MINRILDAFRLRKRRFVLVEAPTGCHAAGTQIRLFDGGVKAVEDIVVGDRLVGPDLTPRLVLALHRGRDQMARIVPRDGDPFVVNVGHVLSLRRSVGQLFEGIFDDWRTETRSIISEDPQTFERPFGLVVNLTVARYLDQQDQFSSFCLYRVVLDGWKFRTFQLTPFTVELLGRDDYFGFEVDQDHLYLMGDYTVTHNSGKSPIGITVAGAMGSSYYAVPQRFLQDQIERDFGSSLVMMKGKSNYGCQVYQGFHCGNAPCNAQQDRRQIRECRENRRCSYYETRDRAIEADLTVLNFSNLLSYMAIEADNWFAPRDLLVIDECHGLGDCLDQYASLELTPATLRVANLGLDDLHQIQRFSTFQEVHGFVGRLVDQIDRLTKGMFHEIDPHQPVVQTLIDDLKDLQDLAMKCRAFLQQREGQYVISPVQDRGYRIGTKVQPLSVAHLKDLAFKAGSQVLLMSATILDPDAFCESLGIDHDEVEYIKVPNTFPTENGVFLYDPVGLMSNRYLRDTLPAMAAKLRSLLEVHRDQKGIVHTASYEVTRYLRDNLDDPRLLFQLTGEDKFRILAEHTARPDATVLVGPGLTEGLDLKGRLGEWGAMVKIPFLSLTDPVVVARKDQDPRWYSWKTAIAITQARGRIYRAAEDRAVFYMLDQCWDNVLRWNRGLYPDYLMDQHQRS